MTARLEIEIEGRPFERAEAELAVAGIFRDDRPLRGGAARADWRLCGRLSELVRDGHLTGACGEALLLPSFGRLGAPRLLILGLGERARFRLTAAQDATREAVGRALDLGVGELVFAPPGIAPDDIPRHAQAILGGALEAMQARPSSSSPLSLRLLAPAAESSRVGLAVDAAIRAGLAGGAQVTLRVPGRVPLEARHPKGGHASL
jgi:Cytosol aminopeptidase family, N-terminal domain